MDEKQLQDLNTLSEPINVKDMQNHLRALIYGEFGVGKTVLAGKTADQEKKHIILTTDPGWVSLKNHPDEIALDKTIVQVYTGASQIKALTTAIKEKAPGFDNVGTVTIDTFSGAVEDYLDLAVENLQFSSGDSRVTVTNKPGKRAIKGSLEIPGIGDYHLARNMFRPIVKQLCQLPCDVFFLCHVREPNFINKNDPRRATLPQQVNLLVSRQCHLVGFMERDGNKRTINFETSLKQVAKSRIKELDGKKIGADEFKAIIQEWKKG